MDEKVYLASPICIDSLNLNIGNRSLLQKFSLQLSQGERIGLTGPSGCGKTTLLHSIISRKLPEGSSSTKFDICNNHFGYAVQRGGLFPWYSLRRNIEFAALEAEEPQPTTELIEYLLDHYELNAVADNYPDELSGGEYQRASLATAISSRSRILIADEPLTGVDNSTKWKVLEQLTNDLIERNSSLLLVSHDVDMLVFLCNKVIVLGGSPANVIETIEISSPAPRFRHDLLNLNFMNIREALFRILINNKL